ncbi:MAG: hypothetical protein AAB393_04965, partial [Bacteroidota bacterium]
GTLVARASDGRWIYPDSGFSPEPGQSYCLTLNQRVSRRTHRPYYIGYPSPSDGVTAPPPEFKQFLDRIHTLEHDIQQLKAEKTELIEELMSLHEENTTLQEEMRTLRLKLLKRGRSESEETDSLPLTQHTLERMLKNCSLEELLGKHPKEKQKQVYRRLMQLIHPDKTRDLGEKVNVILEALVKAVNARYHRQPR